MRKKRRLYGICAGVLAIALSVFLAYLLLGWNREPKTDYSWLVSKAASNARSIESFVFVEPNGVRHIGDPITLRFGVAYDRNIWEVPDDVFHRAFPFPDAFELKERKFHTAKSGNFSILEAKLMVQCLECRDKTYTLDFGAHSSFRVKNKSTGEVTSVHFDSLPKLHFAPLTSTDYGVDEKALVVLPIKEQGNWQVALFVLAGISFIGAISMALARVFLRSRIVPIGEDAEGRSRYLLRVQELKKDLSFHAARSIAHSLYALLLVFRDECGDSSGTLGSILGELVDAYSKDGIGRETLAAILERVEIFFTEQGEV